MLPGFGLSVGEIPVGVLPADQNFASIDLFAGLDPADTDVTLLVELRRVFDPHVDNAISGPPVPVGVLAVGDFDYRFKGAMPGLHFGDHHNYVSLPGDSPSSTLFEGRLDPAYSLTAQLGSEADPLGFAAVDIGSIGISNADRAFDRLLRCSYGSAEAQVRIGKDGWSYQNFRRALIGTVARAQADSESRITLALGTILGRLDGAIKRTYYTGLGGLGAGADLAGQPVRILLGGPRRGLRARLIDAATNTWQFAESLSAMTDVRDRGVAGFTGGADYADFAAMPLPGAMTPGSYVKCLAQGLARFASPVTLITADCTGPLGVGSMAGAILLHVVRNLLGSGRNLTAAEIDTGAFARLDAARPWPCSILIDGETRARDIANRLMRNRLAAVLATRDGLLSCVAYELPGTGPTEIPAAEVHGDGIKVSTRLATRLVTVGFSPCDQPLGPGEMPSDLEVVPMADRLVLQAASAFVNRTRSPTDPARDPYVIATDLVEAAHAAALGDIAADLLSQLTHFYDIPLVTRAPLPWLGEGRRLTYPAYEAAGGISGIVTKLSESSAGGNMLRLWGRGQ